MNIFFLSANIQENANFYAKKHVLKIIIEITQMLYNAHHFAGTEFNHTPYRATHINHPMSKWVRQCQANYLYSVQLGILLCNRYTLEFHKQHACQVRLQWCQKHIPAIFDTQVINHYKSTEDLPSNCSPIPVCAQVDFHHPSIVFSYRMYYLVQKQHLLTAEEKANYVDLWNLRSCIPYASTL